MEISDDYDCLLNILRRLMNVDMLLCIYKCLQVVLIFQSLYMCVYFCTSVNTRKWFTILCTFPCAVRHETVSFFSCYVLERSICSHVFNDKRHVNFANL